ncbi:MAG: hypothetical protein JWM41_1466 [Gemmatimonadetes bacterium]|nr:hypothetical protein [Gemmatimonadota bacterium]
MWCARATPANVVAYRQHFDGLVRPQLETLPGFLGATLLEQLPSDDARSTVDIVVLTHWESMDAVRAFAGDDIERAVVEPDAQAVLVEFERRVRHFHLASDGATLGSPIRADLVR